MKNETATCQINKAATCQKNKTATCPINTLFHLLD